jgi:hypothetical protein
MTKAVSEMLRDLYWEGFHDGENGEDCDLHADEIAQAILDRLKQQPELQIFTHTELVNASSDDLSAMTIANICRKVVIAMLERELGSKEEDD